MLQRIERFFGRFLPLITIMVAVGVLPAIAQQQPSVAIAPSAADSKTDAPSSSTPGTANDDPSTKKVDESAGKSKLEQQTGTAKRSHLRGAA